MRYYHYIIIALTALCLFHAYKNQSKSSWYLAIIFIPVFGPLVYFFTQIINKKNIKKTGTKVNYKINPNKKIKDLKATLQTSETIQNKINLGDALKEKKEYSKALEYYEDAINSNYKGDSYTLKKIIKCYFEVKNYEKVIEYCIQINMDDSFNETIPLYAISLEKCGKVESGAIQFEKINKKYTNYPERLEIAKFYIRNNKKENAKNVLNEVLLEINNMIEANKKKHKYIYLEAKSLLKNC